MINLPFKMVEANQWFVYSAWIFQKINGDTAQALDYAASNGMSPEDLVDVIEEGDFKKIITSAPVLALIKGAMKDFANVLDSELAAGRMIEHLKKWGQNHE